MILKDKKNIFCSNASSIEEVSKLLELKKNFQNLFISVAIHPEYLDDYNKFDDLLGFVYENIENIDFIGETGLPSFYHNENQKAEDLFIKHIELSKEFDKPMILHATLSQSKKALEILKKNEVKNAMFHWCYCDLDTSEKIQKNSYFISINVDYLRNEDYRKFCMSLNLDNILFESDSPYGYNYVSSPYDIEILMKEYSKDKNIEIDYLKEVILNNWKKLTKNYAVGGF